jgi:hypothetical protein
VHFTHDCGFSCLLKIVLFLSRSDGCDVFVVAGGGAANESTMKASGHQSRKIVARSPRAKLHSAESWLVILARLISAAYLLLLTINNSSAIIPPSGTRKDENAKQTM